MIILITLFGLVLRLISFSTQYTFSSEHAVDFLRLRDMWFTHNFFTYGPLTSHSWLQLGPWYYWLFIPVMLAIKWNPIGHGLVMLFLSAAVVPINYWLVKRVFNQSAALFSSFLIAISPWWIIRGVVGFYNTLVILLFYPFFYFLYKRSWLVSGLILGLMFNFHPASIVLLPVSALIVLAVSSRLKKDIFLVTAGFVLPQIPLLIADFHNKFHTILKFALWLPYRSLGLAPLQTTEVGLPIWQFIPQTIVYFQPFLYIFILIFFIFTLSKHRRVIFNSSGYRLGFSILILSLIGLALHRHTPGHYYQIIFPLPVILFSYHLTLVTPRLAKAILVTVFISNLAFIFSDQWLYRSPTALLSAGQVPYSTLLQAAKTIVNEASGAPYQLNRVGAFSGFSGQYAYHYRYLLWLEGNEPVAKSDLVYTIYEIPSDQIPPSNTIFSLFPLTVTKTIAK